MINAIGIYAVGTSGGPGPDPGPTPVYGGIKILPHYNSSGLGTAISEGPIPGISPSFDMVEMECTAIYQRYRVYDSGLVTEYTGLVVAAIDGVHAICFAAGDRYLAITPYKKDATLVADAAQWATDCTLLVGDTVELIDLGVDRAATRATLINSGRFIPHIYKTDLTEERTLTLYIVNFTSATVNTLTPVSVDLDDLAIADNFYFKENSGVSGVAFNHATGELSVAVTCYNSIDGYGFGYIALNINQVTGAINSFFANIPSEPASAFLTPLAGLSSITYACFEDSFQYRAGQYDVGSFDSIVMHTSSFVADKRTFTGRGIDDPYNILTNFVDEAYVATVSLDSAISDKLTSLGFDVVEAIPSTSYQMSPLFADMT